MPTVAYTYVAFAILVPHTAIEKLAVHEIEYFPTLLYGEKKKKKKKNIYIYIYIYIFFFFQI